MISSSRQVFVAVLALATLPVVRAASAACPAYQCGGNSPILFGQPLTNLAVDGTAHDRVRLRPDSLTAPLCRSMRGGGALTLGVERDATGTVSELVGKRGGAVVCRGRELVDARFQIEVTPPRGAMTVVTLQVDAIGRMRTWLRDPGRRHVLPTYRFSVVEAGRTDDLSGKRIRRDQPMAAGAPLCSNRTSFEDWQDFATADREANDQDLERELRGAGRMPEVAAWREDQSHALIVQGQAFDETGGVVATGPQWFNLACMRTGVAKMRLLGVDPMDAALPAGATSATLKMLGARYDGRTAETTPGTPLMWTRAWGDDTAYFGGPPVDATPGPIEAAWGRDGALCLAHFRPGMPILGARLRNSGGYARIIGANEANRVAARRRATGLPTCDPAQLPAGTLWISTTIDHPEHGLTLPETFFITNGVSRSYESGSAPAGMLKKLARPPVTAPIKPIKPVAPKPVPPKAIAPRP